MFRLSSFWQVFTHAVPGGPGFKVASTACFDGLCMGKWHLPIPTPWKPPEAAKQIQKRQPLTRDGSEHLLQVSCALNGLLFLLDNPKPTPPFRIAVRIGLSLWTHVVSSPQHQNLVPDYNLHLLQCDDPCVRHWDNCKIMVYSKLKNTIWLTETYILIFMLSVKIDWSLYRWSLDFYALYIYSSLLRIHNGFYSSRCVIKSLQNEFLMITFVYLNWKI